MKNKDLKRKIVDISFQKGLSHIGSCLTAVDIIDEIFSIKKSDEKFILSSGHAGLALYVVLEKYNDPNTGRSASEIFDHHGVHPDRCNECGIDCSSGSLGLGITIAVGMALADRKKNVYCLLSDGELAEGSVWEALRIQKEQRLTNLKVYINWNGYAAYKQTEAIPSIITDYSINFRLTNMNDYPEWLQGQIAHYKVLDKKEYKELMELY